MNVLVLNCQPAMLKFQVIQTDLKLIAQNSDRRLASGLVDRIGSHSLITFEAEGQPALKEDAPLRDHREALNRALRWIVSPESKIESIRSISDIHAIGHRVVHGGEELRKSVMVDREVIAKIEDCIELAPLDNPGNLKGIRAAIELFGEGIPQVAVFDTAFHSEMPETAYLYGVPYQLYRRHKLRRYGFHGTSHRYVAYRYRQLCGLKMEKVKIITLHLGSGSSICAIDEGRSVNTSMGFTPLEGLLMGTRCGDLDVSLVEFLMHKEGMNLQEIMALLNKQSGLLGLSGLTSDVWELLQEEAEHQDRRSRLALEIYCKRARSYVGQYFVELGGAQAVVFTGGVGQDTPEIRSRICDGLECVGLRLDPDRNLQMHSGKSGLISADRSRLKAYVFPTNEELLIARDTVRVIKDVPRRW
jgi:acetate kinase